MAAAADPPVPLPRCERKKLAVRARLLEASAALFDEKGFAAARFLADALAPRPED